MSPYARGSEKLAAFLTASNMAGLVIVAGPLYVLSAAWPLIPRILALLATAALGIWLTLPQQGIQRYTRLLWRVRGLVWQRAGRRVIGPEDLSGSTGAPASRSWSPVPGRRGS